MPDIHPLAVISPKAKLGQDVSIGPFCVVEADVTIGDRCQLASHVVLKSGTTLAEGNRVGEGSVLGGKPQHLKAGNDLGELRIGPGNEIREFVTIHRSIKPGEATTIGEQNLIMVSSHIGHDCHLGNRTIIANNVMIAGHVSIEDRAFLSGAAGVHQFCRIGALAMVGGQSHITQDVPPYVTVDGVSHKIVGLNQVGLKRAGFTTDDIGQLKMAYRKIYRSGQSWAEMLESLRQEFPTGPAAAFHVFLSGGKRGFTQERRGPRAATIRLRAPEEIEASRNNRAASDDAVKRVG